METGIETGIETLNVVMIRGNYVLSCWDYCYML